MTDFAEFGTGTEPEPDTDEEDCLPASTDQCRPLKDSGERCENAVSHMEDAPL